MPKKLILPRENLFRAVYTLPNGGTPALRAADPATGAARTLQLQWYVANEWTEINSWMEGNFMERIAPGAASKSIRENSANMRILLQHGYDPQLGDKPIAPIDLVEENDIGGYAEGRLFDGLDPLVVDGLRAGQYGASFRFRVMRDEIVEEPEASAYNPKGLPERTIKEMGIREFGPVTWGAYSQASAGVRSITDEMYFGVLRGMPAEKLRAVAGFWRRLDNELNLSERIDSEDIGTLAQMLNCATCYIEDQDEADETGNIAAMQAIQSSLIDLMNVEAQEDEPDEMEDEEAGAAPEGAAHEGTPSRREDAPVEEPAQKATPATVSDYLTNRKEKPTWLL